MLCLCACLFNCALWSPAGKGLTTWLSFVVSNCEFVTFPRVWYLIVSIPDLCTLSYFVVVLWDFFGGAQGRGNYQSALLKLSACKGVSNF